MPSATASPAVPISPAGMVIPHQTVGATSSKAPSMPCSLYRLQTRQPLSESRPLLSTGRMLTPLPNSFQGRFLQQVGQREN